MGSDGFFCFFWMSWILCVFFFLARDSLGWVHVISSFYDLELPAIA